MVAHHVRLAAVQLPSNPLHVMLLKSRLLVVMRSPMCLLVRSSHHPTL